MIYGKGINDVRGSRHTVAGETWMGMYERSYAGRAKEASYVGCSVDKRWERFSNFLPWFEKNYTNGFQLDKDLYVPGNRVYSEDTCLFIPQYLNLMIVSKGGGVSKTPSGKYRVRLRMDGIQECLGTYVNQEDAINVANSFRCARYLDESEKWEGKIRLGLLRHAALLEWGEWDEFA